MKHLCYGLIGLFCICLPACYEDVEGCLDIGATNFDVTADVACPDDCCEFPTLRFQVQTVVSDNTLDTSYVFLSGRKYEVPGAPGDSFAINRLRYFAFDLQLEVGGEEFGVTDEISFTTDSGRLTVEDNFALLEPGSTSTATMGTFPYIGEFSSVSFQAGISPTYQTALPDSIPNGHPFSIATDSTLWSASEGYQGLYMELVTDAAASDTILLQAPFLQDFVYDLTEPIIVPGGFDLTVIFELDIARLFENTAPATQDPEDLIQQIIQNVSESFLIVGYQ